MKYAGSVKTSESLAILLVKPVLFVIGLMCLLALLSLI
jgi:hypothetical protein